MAEVQVNINNRTYRIGCDPGEESRVIELAAFIDRQIKPLAQPGANATDAHLLVLGSILMCDELFKYKEMLHGAQEQYNAVARRLEQVSAELAETRERLEGTERQQDDQSVEEGGRQPFYDEECIARSAETISTLTSRVEAITRQLHNACIKDD